MYIIDALKNFCFDENGGEIVEYAIVIGLLVVGIAAIVISIKNGASNKFTSINAAINTN
jgi:Flp pilus assembly pilin Flp